MAKYTDATIDIDARSWATLMAEAKGDGTYADIFEETKADEGATVPVSEVATKIGAIYGNSLGVVLEQVWDKARSVTVPDATTTTKGIVELATDGENAADKVVQGDDSRLDVVGTSSFVSGGTDWGAFATLGTVPEGEAWVVTGEVSMAVDNGSVLYSGVAVFRISARRRTGAALSVTTMGSWTNGTGTPAAQHNSTAASSNQLTLESRLSIAGTIYQSFRYRVTKIVMP
jgi:hypothetical protein